MSVLFALSLPGLVILLIALGVWQLLRAKVTGKRRPGSASIGIDLLDTVLKPGSEHRLFEKEHKRLQRDETEKGEPPFSEFNVPGKSVTWKKPPTH